MANSKIPKGNWIVKMKCVVEKDVFVSDCTREEAENNPWDYAENENETSQVDWEVISVEENI